MSSVERRRARRFTSKLSVTVRGVDAEGTSFCEATTSINISSEGVYFLVSKLLPQDAVLRVSIIQAEGQYSVLFSGRARVVRWEPVQSREPSGGIGENSCLAAVHFIENLHKNNVIGSAESSQKVVSETPKPEDSQRSVDPGQ